MGHLVLARAKELNFFCYLIRVEHEKYSEMRVWIVRNGQKLKMGLFLVKKLAKESLLNLGVILKYESYLIKV
jgi:hypothetical protein